MGKGGIVKVILLYKHVVVENTAGRCFGVEQNMQD